MTDGTYLREIIEENRWTYTAFADKIGMTREALYKKLNNDTEFKASEIVTITKVLGLTNAQRNRIFLSGKA